MPTSAGLAPYRQPGLTPYPPLACMPGLQGPMHISASSPMLARQPSFLFPNQGAQFQLSRKIFLINLFLPAALLGLTPHERSGSSSLEIGLH